MNEMLNIYDLQTKFNLTNLEAKILQLLIQSEIKVPGETTLGTYKTLQNFKKESPIRGAYQRLRELKKGQVSWRSSKES